MGRKGSAMKSMSGITKAFLGGGLLLLFTLVGHAVAQTCVQPPDGLVSWWPGEGNANDIIDGNNGTLQQDATFAAGRVGQAFSFDGLNDYVEVPDSANLNITGAITLDAWIKTSGTNDFSGIVGKILPVEPRTGYLLNVDSNSKFRCDIIRARPPQGTVVSITSVEDSNWHHVACTYDGATVKVYVDGNFEASVSYTDGIGVNNEPLRIGRDPGLAPNRDFNGLIDEVEVYNRALTDAEIQAIFNAGSAGKCKAATVLDHFKCYRAKGERPNVAVDLADQFGVEPGVLVRKPELFCNPVDKNGEGIRNPTAHLTCYRIKADGKKRDVVVGNQFGGQTLEVKEPELLCVPSDKSDVIP